MNYPYGKFGDCSFIRFGSIVQTDTQSDVDECSLSETIVLPTLLSRQLRPAHAANTIPCSMTLNLYKASQGN